MTRAGARSACAFVLSLALPALAALASDRSLEGCDAEVRDRPRELTSYWCFVDYAEATGDRRGAVERLEAWHRAAPDNPDPLHALAWASRFMNSALAVERLRTAVEIYAREGDGDGEARARIQLMNVLRIRRETDLARAEEAAARRAVERTGDPVLAAQLEMTLANVDYTDSAFADGWRRLRRLELDAGFPDLPARTRGSIYQSLGLCAGALGLHEARFRYLSRQVELSETHGLPTHVSTVAAHAKAASDLARRGRLDRELAFEWIERALAISMENDRIVDELSMRIELVSFVEPAEAIRHLEIVERRARGNPFCRHLATSALYLSGELLVEHFPDRRDEGIELLARGLEEAYGQRRSTMVLTALTKMFRGYAAVGREDLARETGLRALDYLDALAAAQTGERLNVRFYARSTYVHYELIDFLLGRDGAARDDDRSLAWTISERMRARQLRMQLARMESDPGGQVPAEEHRAVLDAISDVQMRRLLARDASPTRRSLDRELERLEMEEETFRAVHEPSAPVRPATIDAVRAALSPDEAIVSFLLSNAVRGGSWALVVTRGDLRAYPLPGREAIAERVWMLDGLLQRRDGGETAGLVGLHRDLTARIVADLPPGIRHLIVIPDGVLHRVPFDALRESADAEPLIARFDVTIVPSASLWASQRARSRAETPGRAVLFADPLPPGGAPRPADLRDALGRLPHARREVRTARRALGRDADVLEGADATEGRLRTAANGRPALLHVAAHTLVDDDTPARSAIVLTADDDGNDGLLQPREIAELRLDGAIVTLSSCRSLDGAVTPGEGVVGLARAFFQARASTVVGGLWPLHDRETRELMERFYDRLGRGESVAVALAGAKRELARAGAPTAAWAGVVAVGDADRARWTRRTGERTVRGPVLAGAIAAVLLAIGLAIGGWALAARRRDRVVDR